MNPFKTTAVFLNYMYYFTRYILFSSVLNLNNEKKLIGKIIAEYHVIEKGLTMPQSRLGFGVEKIKTLDNYVKKFENNFSKNNRQLNIAKGVIKKYFEFHEENNYKFSDLEITTIKNSYQTYNKVVKQRFSEKNIYFEKRFADFESFSRSRASIRNYASKKIPNHLIENSVSIALSAPSGCNRQSIKVYNITDKKTINECLSIQGGNRGFGHLTKNLLVITSDYNLWHGVSEIFAGYVDGGFFSMNLLHALHYNGIVSCPLNCNLLFKKDLKLRNILKIKKSENFIVMISCGFPPNKFNFPASTRNKTSEHITHIN